MLTRNNKDRVIDAIANAEGVDAALKLVVELKVALLADADANGGLNASSRKRAWKMAHELGEMLAGKGVRQ